MNKQILICVVAIIAFVIGFYAGKKGLLEEHFYMSKKTCESCTTSAYNEAKQYILQTTGNNCLSDNKVCLDKYKSLVGVRCPGC